MASNNFEACGFLFQQFEEDSDRCGILPNFAEAKTMGFHGVTSRERERTSKLCRCFISWMDAWIDGWMVSVIDKIKKHLVGILRNSFALFNHWGFIWNVGFKNATASSIDRLTMDRMVGFKVQHP